MEAEGRVIGAVEVVNEAVVEKERRPHNTFLTKVSHEELETDQSKDTQAENGQDHDVSELLHRLDEGTNDGLQAWEEGAERGQWNPPDLCPNAIDSVLPNRLSLNAIDSVLMLQTQSYLIDSVLTL